MERAQNPGGWRWVRADDPQWVPPPPPAQHDLYDQHEQHNEEDDHRRQRFQSWREQEHHHHHASRQSWPSRPELAPSGRREESDASLEVMDIHQYAETLRSSTPNSYQPESSRGSPRPSPGPPQQRHRPHHSLSSVPSLAPSGPRPRPLPSAPSSSSTSPTSRRPPPPPKPISAYYPPPDPHNGYLLPIIQPPSSPSPSIPSSSYAARPAASPTVSTRYHYSPPPEADHPGYFPPNTSIHLVPEVFASQAPHHHRLERPDTGVGGVGTGAGGEDVLAEREALKGFPKWSRDWFKAERTDRRGEYEGVNEHAEERWEGGGLTGGDLGESAASWGGPRSSAGGSSGVTGRTAASGLTPEEREQRIKERRLRRLEKEFGTSADAAKRSAAQAEPVVYPVGALDPKKGTIVTAGPRKRLAIRWTQGILTLAVCALALYPIFLIKLPPPPSLAPPPKGTLPFYLLSALSVLSLILVLVFLLIRPLCCSGAGRGVKDTDQMGAFNPLGGSMLIGTQQHGKKGKKGKKGGGNMQGGFQVNLVMDPRAFHQSSPPPVAVAKKKKKKRRKHRTRRRREDDDDGLLSSSFSSSSTTSSSSSEDDIPTAPPRTYAQTLLRRQRRAWSHRWLVRMLWFDSLLGLLWLACTTYILWKGKRCPVGRFQGWCDCYNSALAGGVVLGVMFWGSAGLGVGDVRRGDPTERIGGEV